uniref:Peptidase S1 domain-containing protein n=1 Tax=Panagrolaimus superbus TaxID=310955 RepID=A0A914Y183_9BILA
MREYDSDESDWSKKQETFGNHNLALIRIKPIEFSTHIRPICLTNYESILEGSSVTVIGSGLNWGLFNLNEGGEPRKAEITVRHSSKCNFTNGKENKTLCAGNNFVGLRDGDEGAPLLAFYQSRFYLIGIVTLEREELTNPFFQGEYPILFTRIAAYCKTFLQYHSNVECSNNVIPIEATTKHGYSCGAVSESRTRKRAIGENLNLLQPWYCKIKNENDFEICGATLISFKYVLSAAHCFNLGGESFKNYTIHCGIDLKATAKISKVTKSTEFKQEMLENDIAVIELETEIGFNGKVGAACLIEDDKITVENINDFLIAVGSDNGEMSTVKSIRLHTSKSTNCEAE